ncbi:unnamed protein product, partial [Effrenium voratum]
SSWSLIPCWSRRSTSSAGTSWPGLFAGSQAPKERARTKRRMSRTMALTWMRPSMSTPGLLFRS